MTEIHRREFLTRLTAAAALVGLRPLSPSAAWQTPVTLGDPLRIFTAGPGSGSLPYAQGLSAYLRSTGVDTVVVETAGSIDNIRRLGQDRHSIGTVFMGSAFEANAGTGDWNDGTVFSELRALFPMYETSFQLAALASSGVSTVQGLAGKTLGVGPGGGPAAIYFAGLADALGLRVTAVYGQPADLVESLISGRIDALWQGAPSPIPALAEVTMRAGAKVFGLTEHEQTVMTARFPFLTRATVPPGTYRNQTDSIFSVGAWNFVLAHRDCPDEDAYRLTRAALGSIDPQHQIHSSAGGTHAANASRNGFLPLHPGAARYLRERGINILPGPGPER